MLPAIFISDLHGSTSRCEKLFSYIEEFLPEILFIGGDFMPNHYIDYKINGRSSDFLKHYFAASFKNLKDKLKDRYPQIFIILGNDDARIIESSITEYERLGIWQYIHNRKISYKDYNIFGYSYVPPTPFLLKDWEKYDVSRYADPGCIEPPYGKFTVPVDIELLRFSTIKEDLDLLTKNENLSNAIFLFHSPPHNTNLDKIETHGKMIDGVPIDPHVGSFAIRNLIDSKKPLVTLHGHIHESSEMTGSWRDCISDTPCYSAAYNHSNLAIISFNLYTPKTAERILL